MTDVTLNNLGAIGLNQNAQFADLTCLSFFLYYRYYLVTRFLLHEQRLSLVPVMPRHGCSTTFHNRHLLRSHILLRRSRFVSLILFEGI
jgi:hypothetical protein